MSAGALWAVLAPYALILFLVALGRRICIVGDPAGGRRWELWFGMGTLVWTYSLFLLNCAGVPMTQVTLGVVTGLWLAFAVLWPPKTTQPWSSEAVASGRSARWPIVVAGAAFLLVFGTLWLEAEAWPMHHWDGLVFYAAKAQRLFYAGTWREPGFLDPQVVHANADYPLLAPYLEAGFYALIGQVDDRRVNVLFLAFWVAWMVLLWKGLRHYLDDRVAALFFAVFVTLPGFAAEMETYGVSGSLDIPLGYFWTAAAMPLLVYRPDDTPPKILWPLLILAMVWTKPEGTVLSAFLILFWILGRRPPMRDVAAVAGLSFVLIAPWLWVRSQMPHNSGYYASDFHWMHLRALPSILRWWAKSAGEPLVWGIFWPLVVLSFLPWRRATVSRPVADARWLLAGQFAIYLSAYLFTNQDIERMVRTSVGRITLHGAGLALWALAWQWGSAVSKAADVDPQARVSEPTAA